MSVGSLIVLMTDFGTENWFAAAMKGEILRRAPNAAILDLTHEVPRHAIEHAAFILHCAMDSFPRQTIFCCVVDPGVGSKRRGIVGRVGEYAFVGPDNGLITPLVERAPDDVDLYEIKSAVFRNPTVSPTFHGRDVFAPASARMMLGDDPRLAGPRVTDPILLSSIRAREQAPGLVLGKVMVVDHFGNAITNVDRAALGDKLSDGNFELTVHSLTLNTIESIYDEKPKGQALCYWGSSGFLEIAINYGSAAERFNIRAGDTLTVALKS